MRRATCILWDIDGTLTEFVHPTGDRFTSYFETRGLTMANPAPELVGTTEAGIVASYLNSDSHEDIGYHLRAMDAKWLLEDTSRAVPIASAKDLMLEMRDFTLQTIVTGNTYLRATKKLHDAGFLDCGIDIGRGAFGDESTSRADLVRLAIARCRRAKPGVPPENWNFVCIGDTPIDGAAARSAGAAAVLVATGKYTQGMLASCSGAIVLPDLTEGRGRFFRLLREIDD